MPTLDTSRWARGYRHGQTTHAAVRDGTTTTGLNVNPTSTAAGAIRYGRVAGRGGTFYDAYRMFYYFDTSGITGTVSAATLNIKGFFSNNGDVIVVPSTAFAGDGSANMVSSEFGNILFNTAYGAEFTSWSTSGNNAIPLAATALSKMKDYDYFICAVIEYDYDYLDTDPGGNATPQNGVDYDDPLAYLDYTVAAGYGNTVSGVASANISKVCGVATASIENVMGV